MSLYINKATPILIGVHLPITGRKGTDNLLKVFWHRGKKDSKAKTKKRNLE